jgi:hypothetical protein
MIEVRVHYEVVLEDSYLGEATKGHMQQYHKIVATADMDHPVTDFANPRFCPGHPRLLWERCSRTTFESRQLIPQKSSSKYELFCALGPQGIWTNYLYNVTLDVWYEVWECKK